MSSVEGNISGSSSGDHKINVQANCPNGHGVTIDHSKTGKSVTKSENIHFDAFKNDTHAVEANAFHSRTEMENGLKFDRFGGNAIWNHADGHGASLEASRIPKFNMTQIDAAAKANMYSSPNKATTVDFNATATRHLSGPFAGKNNFGGNVNFKHQF